MTPPGIDPETVRLVAQCLNLYATPGPRFIKSFTNYKRVLTFRHTLQPTHTHTPAMPRHCNGPPPLFCIWFPLQSVAKPARRHCVMTAVLT